MSHTEDLLMEESLAVEGANGDTLGGGLSTGSISPPPPLPPSPQRADLLATRPEGATDESSTGQEGGAAAALDDGESERAHKVPKLSHSASPASSSSAKAAAAKEIIDIDADDQVAPGAAPLPTPTKAVPPIAPAAAASSSASGSSLSRLHHVDTRARLHSGSFAYVEAEAGSAGVSEYLLCGLCSRALYQPVQHKTCANVYCGACCAGLDAPPGGTKEGALGAQCPECHTAIRPRDTLQPAKPLLMLLDALVVRCPDCNATMPRSTFGAHWLDSCAQACPFTPAGCSERLLRSSLNAHIDICPYTPVSCAASEFGCVWAGQRDASVAHQATCPYHMALPAFRRVRNESAAALALKDGEIAALRVALETREGQLRSHTRATTDPDTGMWRVGTLIDTIDTEESWLLAKIIRVDTAPKRQYLVHYCDWDSSWDEIIAHGSPRLQAGGTHTTAADVEKHVRKFLAAAALREAQGLPPLAAAQVQPVTPTTPTTIISSASQPAQTKPTVGGKYKRKSVLGSQ